jgi:hypothetical protein
VRAHEENAELTGIKFVGTTVGMVFSFFISHFDRDRSLITLANERVVWVSKEFRTKANDGRRGGRAGGVNPETIAFL